MPSWRIDSRGRWEPIEYRMEPLEDERPSLGEELREDLMRALPWLILVGGTFLLVVAYLYGGWR